MMNTTGRVLRRAFWYDLQSWLWTGGKERAFRERLLSFVPLTPGSKVLDIGCGTGSLAIALRQRLGSTADVIGIDASEEMIARARAKAKAARLPVTFERAIVETLPFADKSFDVVLSTLMLHHLPKAARTQCIAEIARVLKPGGTLLVADFESSNERTHGLLGLVHRPRHGSVRQEAIANLLADAGLRVVRSAAVGIGSVHVTIAEKDATP